MPGTLDMSLRLWSDDVALAPLTEPLGLVCDVTHVRGRAMASDGPLAGHIARRHYASVATTRSRAGEGLDAWLAALLDRLTDTPLARAIAGHRVEAVFWIAVLGDERLADPVVPASCIGSVSALPASLLIENYTTLDDGNPRKTWLVAQPTTSAA